jgi:hypothetical protein
MHRIQLYLVCTILVGSLALGRSPTAQAQTPAPGLSALNPVGPFIVRFNENGSATIQVGSGGLVVPLVGSTMLDPTAAAGSGQLALTYLLPEPVITGTVSFTEPGSTLPSDWIRFTDAIGTVNGSATGAGPRLIFYSDVPEAGETPDLADIGPPPVKAGDNILVCGVSTFCSGETGAEGNNSFDYRPGGAGIAFPLNNEYIGISDIVVTTPEPTSLVLLVSGLGAVGLLGRRHRIRLKA